MEADAEMKNQKKTPQKDEDNASVGTIATMVAAVALRKKKNQSD